LEGLSFTRLVVTAALFSSKSRENKNEEEEKGAFDGDTLPSSFLVFSLRERRKRGSFVPPPPLFSDVRGKSVGKSFGEKGARRGQLNGLPWR